jgi:hypothetical protein
MQLYNILYIINKLIIRFKKDYKRIYNIKSFSFKFKFLYVYILY